MSNSYVTILDKLSKAVENNAKYKVEDALNKNLLAEDARKYDGELLNLLQKDASLKSHFFTETDGGLVFKKDVFLQFISNKEFLPDSYTRYANKIGLGSDDSSLLSGSKDVVLNWPYKDAILEGGQDKEDQKRSEVFFNEVLAPDQITRLLDDKVFTNWKRYDKDGEHVLDELKDDDNLIIKGNNLVVLHSLKKRYAGKVKLIYIDPPYNTGNDGFGYNDRFNHSTWLTFMKNRLSIAKTLLSKDGFIFVHCDDNEQAYLKVLMDEIFSPSNFIACTPVVINRGGRDYGGIARTHEYILMYKKTPEAELNLIEEVDKKFTFEDESGGFNLMELRNRNILFNDKNRPNLCYPFYVNPSQVDENGLLEISLEPKDGYQEVMPLKSQGVQTVWRWGKERASDNLNKTIFGKPRQGGGYMIVQKYRATTRMQRSILDDKEFVNERGTEHIKALFNDKVFAYPKSEHLLKRIIELATNEGDLVMDYHVGSGTAAAAAHKMNRHYIAVEQMKYIDSVTVGRQQKVIEGEDGGISKSVGWQGGGSFVYANIMNNANKFRKRLEAAKSDADYLELLKEATGSSFLSYRVDPTKLNENEFRKLSSADKRRLLLELIDNNTLYVNYEDINDPSFKVSDTDKKFNKELYK